MAGQFPFRPRPQAQGNNQNQQQNQQNQQRDARGRRPAQENPHRINDEITAPQVRVVGENVEPNLVLSIKEAIRLADEMELDLIEISPKAEPPVCRIADYQKFLYQQKKKAKEIKAKPQSNEENPEPSRPHTRQHEGQRHKVGNELLCKPQHSGFPHIGKRCQGLQDGHTVDKTGA